MCTTVGRSTRRRRGVATTHGDARAAASTRRRGARTTRMRDAAHRASRVGAARRRARGWLWTLAAAFGAARGARRADGADDARPAFGRVFVDARDRGFRDSVTGRGVRALGANVCAWTTRGRRARGIETRPSSRSTRGRRAAIERDRGLTTDASPRAVRRLVAIRDAGERDRTSVGV